VITMADAVPLGKFGFPLTQQKETDIEGKDFDTYASPDQFTDYWPSNIPFHNARQRHVGIKAFVKGLRTTMWENLPECPPLWQDVGHYWDGCAAIGYEVKSKVFTIFVFVAVAIVYKNPGIIGQLLPLAMKTFGM